MARPRRHGPRVTTAIRFPEEVHAALRREADERDVSINHLVVKAARAWLEAEAGEETLEVRDGAGEIVWANVAGVGMVPVELLDPPTLEDYPPVVVIR